MINLDKIIDIFKLAESPNHFYDDEDELVILSGRYNKLKLEEEIKKLNVQQ